MKNNILLTLVFLTLLSANSAGQNVNLYLGGLSPEGSALRSAFFPGWGQFHNGCKSKGWVIVGLEAAGGTFAYVYYRKAEKKYDKYTNVGIKDDSLYRDYENALDSSRIAGLFCCLIWGYSIIESYNYAKDNDFGVSIGFDTDSVRINAVKKFTF